MGVIKRTPEQIVDLERKHKDFKAGINLFFQQLPEGFSASVKADKQNKATKSAANIGAITTRLSDSNAGPGTSPWISSTPKMIAVTTRSRSCCATLNAMSRMSAERSGLCNSNPGTMIAPSKRITPWLLENPVGSNLTKS